MRFLSVLAGAGVSALLAGCSGLTQGTPTLPATPQGSIPPAQAALPLGRVLAKAPNWAQPGYNAAHTGDNPLERTLGRGNVGGLQLGFDFTTGNGILAPIVMAKNTAYADSTDGNLYAINAQSGAKIWSFASGYGDWPQGVAVAGSRAFVTCQIDSGHAGLCAVNVITGKRLWSWAIYHDPPSNPVDSSPYNAPVVSGNTVILGESDTASFGHVGYLTALDVKTGSVVWTIGNCGANGGNDCNGLGRATAAVQKGVVYYGAPVVISGNFFYSVCAVALSDGSSGWCTTVNDPNPAIAVSGNTVYANTYSSSTQTLYALNAATGGILWTHSFSDGGNQDLTPAAAGKTVYVSGANNLYALQAASGKQIWETVAAGTAYAQSSPSVANGVVYASCSGLCAFSTSKGKLLWSSQPGVASSTPTAPAIANGTLFGVCRFQEACSFHL